MSQLQDANYQQKMKKNRHKLRTIIKIFRNFVWTFKIMLLKVMEMEVGIQKLMINYSIINLDN